MRRSRLIVALFFALAVTPALAQFPPPGVYKCTFMDGTPTGMLTLFVAGDYQFDGADGVTGKGQVASAGSDVTALSGPLFDSFHLKGRFATDERGEAEFGFNSDLGQIHCGLPAR